MGANAPLSKRAAADEDMNKNDDEDEDDDETDQKNRKQNQDKQLKNTQKETVAWTASANESQAVQHCTCIH